MPTWPCILCKVQAYQNVLCMLLVLLLFILTRHPVPPKLLGQVLEHSILVC